MCMYNMTSDLNLVSFERVLEEAQNGVDSILVVSGGLDSAYILWKYSQVVTDRPIYLHHIDMYASHTTRAYAQRVALNYQMQYLGRDFRLFTSKLDTSDNTPVTADWVLSAIMTTNVAAEKDCRYVVVGDDLPDSYHRGLSFSEIPERKEKMYRLAGEYIRAASNNHVDLCTALHTPNLSDAYNEMPLEYTRLASSCRDPKITEYTIDACGECHSCIKNQNFGWWERMNPYILRPEVT